jgi:uncharacterized protein YjiS (DUF1127 family)
MRLLAHVLARLAITATCTSSAAALEAQVEHDKYPFSNSLWEHLMLNSSESVNGGAIRHSVPSRELRFDSRDKRGLAHEDANSLPVVMPATSQADRQNTAPWSSIFAFFIEGFALYGASYCASPQAITTSPVESCPAEATPQLEEISWRERRRSIVLVSSSTSPEVTELVNDANPIGRGSDTPSADDSLAKFYGFASLDAERPSDRGWRTKAWATVASRWARWHREREIKKAVAALAEFDDRTLRDIGIPHSSEIERVLGCGRNC